MILSIHLKAKKLIFKVHKNKSQGLLFVYKIYVF